MGNLFGLRSVYASRQISLPVGYGFHPHVSSLVRVIAFTKTRSSPIMWPMRFFLKHIQFGLASTWKRWSMVLYEGRQKRRFSKVLIVKNSKLARELKRTLRCAFSMNKQIGPWRTIQNSFVEVDILAHFSVTWKRWTLKSQKCNMATCERLIQPYPMTRLDLRPRLYS